MMLKALENMYPLIRVKNLEGRYITMHHLKKTSFYDNYKTSKRIIGTSVQQSPIELFTIGTGVTKLLIWSQMHGNESTTTKALGDLFLFLEQDHTLSRTILKQCTLYIIPILNPDGALAYTRANANAIDLNRDAQMLSQPESKILRTVFAEVKPDFCFNLHDQRSIYGVGNTGKTAAVSFLSPSQDRETTVTPTRKKSMQLIVAMNHLLQKVIPGHVGRYDDTFNIQCVGDTFQRMGVPTLLFEAGHFKSYQRDDTRRFIFYALVQGLYTIAKDAVDDYSHTSYFDIPENRNHFFDILVTHVPISDKNNTAKEPSVGIHYDEVLENENIKFIPVMQKIGNLSAYYGHQLLNYKTEKHIKNRLKEYNIQNIIDNLINS